MELAVVFVLKEYFFVGMLYNSKIKKI